MNPLGLLSFHNLRENVPYTQILFLMNKVLIGIGILFDARVEERGIFWP